MKSLNYNKSQIYLCLSLLTFVLIGPAIYLIGETNIPPLNMSIRYFILGLYANLFLAYHLTCLNTKYPLSTLGWLLGILPAATLLATLFPVFSGDMMYYLMRGRILGVYGDSPYLHTPSEYLNDILKRYDTWPNQTDAYGPISVYWQTWPTIIESKVVGVMIWLYKISYLFAITPAVWAFSQLCKNQTQENQGRNWALFAFSPLLLIYAFVDGHNDILLMSFFVVSVYFLTEKKFARAYLFFTLAFLIKYMVVLVLPFYIIYTFRHHSKPVRFYLLHFPANVLLIVLLFAPIWGGMQTFAPHLSATDWFYSSSIPYAFKQIIDFMQIPMESKNVQQLFLFVYAVVYIWCLIHFIRRGSDRLEHQRLFRVMFVAYLGFYISLVSPLMGWYLIWAFPWLILSQYRKTTLLVVLYSLVALLGFYKRTNYLSILAVSFYWLSLQFGQTRFRGLSKFNINI